MIDFAGYEIEEGKEYIPLTGMYKGKRGVCCKIKNSLKISEADKVQLVIGCGIFKYYYPHQIVKAKQ